MRIESTEFTGLNHRVQENCNDPGSFFSHVRDWEMFFHMPQAAAEGAQTLLPVYVFDREKFNTLTLAGEESETSREKSSGERDEDFQRLICT